MPFDLTSSAAGLTPYGHGKFDRNVDAWAYDRSLEGCDEESGSVDEGGWFGLLRGLTTSGPFSDLTPAAIDEHDLSAEDVAWIEAHSAGVILHVTTDGFVEVAWFADPAELEATWEGCSGGEDGDVDEPSPDDYVISDAGPLGSQYSVDVVEGRHVGVFDSGPEAARAIREDAGDFRPDVWYVSDHGNADLCEWFRWEES